MRRIVLTGVALAAVATAAVVVPGLSGAAAHRPARQRAVPTRSATFRANRRQARAFAQRHLRGVPLPPGAVRHSTDPAGTVLKHPVSVPGDLRLIDRHRFWLVPGDPGAVLRWYKHHAPASTRADGTGVASDRSGPYEWSLSFAYRHPPPYLYQGELDVSVAAAGGGGTGVRVDSFATPLVPRPRWERVPARARVVAVTATGWLSATRQTSQRKFSYPLSTVTDAATVGRLIRYINTRQIMQPGSTFSCPPSLGPMPSLRFTTTTGSPALATVGPPSCGYSSFRLGKRHGPAIGPMDLTPALWRLHAMPACPASELTARIGAARRHQVAVNLRYTGTGACALDGFPRVRLLGRSGRRLPTHVSRNRAGGPPYPVLLVPRSRAEMSLSWSGAAATCGAPHAQRIALRLPRTGSWLTVSVGPTHRPLAPCHGQVTVDSVQAVF